jgi:hydroxyacylglutathione hydrolase
MRYKEVIMKQEITRIDLEGVNCYLVKAGDGFVLFDTGGHLTIDKQFTNRRERLEAALDKAGCKPGDIKLVILTHGDNDHTANAAYLKDKYKLKIAMHKGDLELVENPVLEKVMESFRYRSVMLKLVFLLLKNRIKKVTVKILKDFEKFTPDFFIDETFDLSEYGMAAKILHIPGHTAGSIGILTNEGDLISGDTFVNNGKPSSAPNACDFKKLAASIGRLKKMNIKAVYPGHGEPYTL